MPFERISHLILGLSVVCILLTLVAIGAQADDKGPQILPAALTTESADEVQKTIVDQLDAIKNRDADSAYAQISGSLHDKFETAKDYLSHLRLQLRPIYNHEGYDFLDQSTTQSGKIQKVKIEDRYGEPVTAIYHLKQDESGNWRITSFAILPLDSDPI